MVFVSPFQLWIFYDSAILRNDHKFVGVSLFACFCFVLFYISLIEDLVLSKDSHFLQITTKYIKENNQNRII